MILCRPKEVYSPSPGAVIFKPLSRPSISPGQPGLKVADALSPGEASHGELTGKKPRRSLESLDFLRGWMAAFVMFSHMVLATNSLTQIKVFFELAGFAVRVFMFISGFLMMWHFIERRRVEPWEAPRSWFTFYVRRYFRIAPLYYVALALALVFQAGLQHLALQNEAAISYPFASGPLDPTNRDLTAGNILAHVSFLFGFIPRYAANNHLPDWSIGLEMQFYLAFPFIALLLDRTQYVLGTILLVAAQWVALHLFTIGITADHAGPLGVFPAATFLPFQLACFLSGILIAAGLAEENPRKQTALVMLGLGAAVMDSKRLLLVAFLFVIYELSRAQGTGLAPLDRVMNRLSGLIKLRVFHWMAEVSYGVYLLHTLVLTPVVWLLLRTGKYAALPPAERFLLCLVIVTPLVYAGAALLHFGIEKPGIALGRKLVRRVKPTGS
jgi:peptidoglycan/LPS O-acetylase OafA/YrhL